jgi:hypothetical protein
MATMLQVQMNLVDKNRGTFSKKFDARLRAFEMAVDTASRNAAVKTQKHSQQRAKAVRPPAPPRAGRASPPGALAKAINWKVDPSDKNFIILDVGALDSQVSWWRVQEIGTGKSATMRKGGQPNPRGQVAKGASYRVQVKSQKGRVLPGHLVFVSRAGNAQRFSDRSKKQALVPRAQAKKESTIPVRRRVIRNEIEGKHFIRDGAREGFRDYRKEVLAAARATLGKR